ncbi:IS21 family transposase, partial [Shinella kummerowiae]|nr:IS21 family transposase [Shinella kummerowiae]
MELYLKVRLAVSEGMTRRQAAKHFNVSRDSVAKMLSYSTPPGYQRRSPIRRPKLDAFVSTIEQWLEADMVMPRKQRHTAKRVFDRLRDECGFTGGYTIIKDYMRERDQRRQEVFVPLSHPPGHAQADFGEATVVIGGVEQKARFFVLDLPHSDGCYVRAYPAAVAEAWVDGHIHAFAFFGAVPQFPTWDAFNAFLEEQCRKRQRDRLRGESETIGERLQRDLAAMRPLPASPFDACDQASAVVTAQSLVRYKTNDYSVPVA